jgi:pantoate--beta-alanine ligase
MVREALRGHLMRGKGIGLVPTMGALHAGHMSLVRAARMENDIVVASIFVNPSQFGPGEDLDSYPRDPDGDMNLLREAGVDILFMPPPAEMYGEGHSTFVDVGPIATKLCGAFRPTHFRGVATVVMKLFSMVLPARAYFGQKDFQQCMVIMKAARELDIPVDIIICPTVREPDGLALSSRNSYLTGHEREAAPVLYRALTEAAGRLKAGGVSTGEIKEQMEEALRAEPLVSEIQYIGCYDPESLDWLEEFGGRALLAGAVRIGKARLIDNVLV